MITVVIDKICKMTVKGVKLKSESFFLISPGVLELRRKNLRGDGFRPRPRIDRVKLPLREAGTVLSLDQPHSLTDRFRYSECFGDNNHQYSIMKIHLET